MATLFIREYSGLGRDITGLAVQTGLEPISLAGMTDRTLVISGTATLTSITTDARFLRLNTDVVCSYKVGTASTVVATATNARMAAGGTEWVALSGNTIFISVIVNT